MSSRTGVDEIAISQLRRDSALALRGVLVIAILPGMALLMLAMRELSDAQTFELQQFASWKVWLPLLAAFAIMLVVRRFTLRFDRRALISMVWGYAVLATGAIAALVWQIATHPDPIPWGQIGSKIATDVVLQVAILFLLALSTLLLWYSALAPLGAAYRLLRGRLPDGRSVMEVMDGIGTVPQSLDLPQPSRTARIGRLACSIGAVFLGVVMVASVVWLLAKGDYILGLGIEFALLAAIIGLQRLGQRIAAIDAKTLLEADNRRPVLFLRSFQDDPDKLEGEWGSVIAAPEVVARSAPGRFVGALLKTTPARKFGSIGVPRLEEVIAAEVGKLGPFVAIGSPGEPLPMLGAARAYYDNDTWQTAIRRWIDMAQLIVKLAGPTNWIRWELSHIIEQGALMRLIVVFPMNLTAADRQQRWENIVSCFDETPWRDALATMNPQAVMALRFRPDGGLQAITQAAHRGLDATLAMRILLNGMLRDGVIAAQQGATSPSQG